MTDPRPSPGAGPSVCPFVALAEDRDRRADTPDESNRCYAERAPRRRDLVHQAEYCYSPQFAACPVFLGWAARNAAEPAYVTEAAQRAWAGGIAAPEDESTRPSPADDGDEPPEPPSQGGLFGPDDPGEAAAARTSEQLDWVPAAAWAEAPWDERAELEAEEWEALAEQEVEEPEEAVEEPPDEATQAPKVPAALPMRRRKRPDTPIRSRGSGEWFYADPPGHEALVKRRYGVTPPILLAVLGLLLLSIMVFLIATQLGGGSAGTTTASPTPPASLGATATRAPSSAAPSVEPSPTREPAIRNYTVKPGDALSSIAAKRGVDVKVLQCYNGLKNPDLLSVGQVLQIPPEGYTCARGWRNATPSPEPGATEELGTSEAPQPTEAP